jgi:hypothetical protein
MTEAYSSNRTSLALESQTPAARPSSVRGKKKLVVTTAKKKNTKTSPDSTMMDTIGYPKAKSAEKTSKMKQPKLAASSVLNKPIQFDSL